MGDDPDFLACTVNLQWIGQALKKYYNTHGRLPSRLAELVPDYLTEIPACPVAGKDTYSLGYHIEKETDETDAVLSCAEHKKGDKPRYRLRIFQDDQLS